MTRADIDRLVVDHVEANGFGPLAVHVNPPELLLMVRSGAVSIDGNDFDARFVPDPSCPAGQAFVAADAGGSC